MDTVLKVEELSKMYRLGQIGAGSLREELDRLWSKMRSGKKDKAKAAERYNSESNEFWALRDVHFELERGDVLGVIGRNGAGKSTLLKLISRITEPTRGSIAYKGRIASLLEVGTGFHPELSGKDNIFLNGAILGMRRSEIRAKMDDIVEFAGVGPHLHTPVKRYSSGMYVRLAFSIAAHLDPDILIVDEVLAVGDSNFQKKCVGKLKDVSSNGRTVIFVSHNLGLVKSFCQKGLLLHNGQTSYFGKCSEAIEKYLEIAKTPTNNSFDVKNDQPVSLTDVFVKSLDNSNVIQTGVGLLLGFKVRNMAPYPEAIDIYFEIYNSSGILVSVFRTSERGELDTISKTTNDFICEIHENTLIPGEYLVDVVISENQKTVDHIQSALIFKVEEGHRQGRYITRKNQPGTIHLDHRWIRPY